MPAALTLPEDTRVREALATLGLATAAVIGPADVKAMLSRPLSAEEARALAGELDRMARMLAG